MNEQEIFDAIFNKVSLMTDEEFRTELNSYENHPIVRLLDELDAFNRSLDTSRFVKIAISGFDLTEILDEIYSEFELTSAANDERFALAA